MPQFSLDESVIAPTILDWNLVHKVHGQHTNPLYSCPYKFIYDGFPLYMTLRNVSLQGGQVSLDPKQGIFEDAVISQPHQQCRQFISELCKHFRFRISEQPRFVLNESFSAFIDGEPFSMTLDKLLFYSIGRLVVNPVVYKHTVLFHIIEAHLDAPPKDDSTGPSATPSDTPNVNNAIDIKSGSITALRDTIPPPSLPIKFTSSENAMNPCKASSSSAELAKPVSNRVTAEAVKATSVTVFEDKSESLSTKPDKIYIGTDYMGGNFVVANGP